jgi:hypothetical protein
MLDRGGRCGFLLSLITRPFIAAAGCSYAIVAVVAAAAAAAVVQGALEWLLILRPPVGVAGRPVMLKGATDAAAAAPDRSCSAPGSTRVLPGDGWAGDRTRCEPGVSILESAHID